MSSLPCLRQKDGYLMLAVRVQPGARKSEIIGLLGVELKVKVASPPVDGAANNALIDFIAASLGLRSNRVELVHGERSRSKVLKLEGISMESAVQTLTNLASD